MKGVFLRSIREKRQSSFLHAIGVAAVIYCCVHVDGVSEMTLDCR